MMMTDETTTEQLAEIEGQGESTPVTGYTPPEGWRVLVVGEVLREGDMWVWPTDDQLRQTRHIGAVVGANQRYIRRIEPQPQLQPEPQAPMLQDADQMIKLLSEANHNHVAMIGRLMEERNDRQVRILELKTIRDNQAATIEELRSEVSYVQNLLGTERRRVAELEELVASLRTINDAQEKAFEAAGQHNSDLQSRLNAVCSEWVQQAETIRRLQIELDAAQQVPADSPELRQLRADLAEVTQDRDTYKHAHELLLNDANATHQRTKAMTVEAIVEWLEPVRATIEAADNVQQTMRADNLACDIIRNLPGILRYVVGLNHPEEIE